MSTKSLIFQQPHKHNNRWDNKQKKKHERNKEQLKLDHWRDYEV